MTIKSTEIYGRDVVVLDDGTLCIRSCCEDAQFHADDVEPLAVALIQTQPPWPEHEESVRIYGWDVQRDIAGVYLFPPGVEGTNDILEPHDAIRLGLALIRAAKETR